MPPIEMHIDIGAEWAYIRGMTAQVNRVKKQQYCDGLKSVKPGDIVMVHLDCGKTAMKSGKQRRRFDEVGIFLGYRNGNCVIQMKRDEVFRKPIEVPIFSVNRIPHMGELIRETFNIRLG